MAAKITLSENAWRPGKLKKEPKADDDAGPSKDTMEVFRKFKSILNKLTPQKFTTLMDQTMQLPINTEERLNGIIDLVFEKAITEPGFSQAYANMCRVMTTLSVPVEGGNAGEKVNFRKLLLLKCQREFEKEKKEEEIAEQRQKILDLPDGQEKTEKLEEFDLQQFLVRKSTIGNIRFIGELFKLQLLSENVMHNCIFRLLKAKDEESLECMSKLIMTVGKTLDHDKGKPRMDQYFAQIEKIIKEKRVSARIRFMLQDVQELRRSSWKPRRNEKGPMTIDQIRKEAEVEKIREEQENLAQRFSSRENKRPQRGSVEKNFQSIEDGWNTVPGGNRSTKQNQIGDPSKLRITRTPIDDNIKLGPGGRPGGMFSGWGKGASGGGSARMGQAESEKVTQVNRYSMLGRQEEGKRGSSLSRERDSKPRMQSGSKRSSRERDIDRSREKQSAIAEVQRLTGRPNRSQSREKDRDLERRLEPQATPQPAPPAAAPTPVSTITESEFETKSTATINEYLNIKDKNEAIECVKELQAPQFHNIFVRLAIEQTLEKNPLMRESIGRLFHCMLSQSIISIEQFLKGLNEILEFADDMAIDIPLIWNYLGEIIGAMAAEGAQTFVFLTDSLKLLSKIDKAGIFMAAVLKAGVKLTSEEVIARVWRSSNHSWDQLLPPGTNVQEFLERNGLGFTIQSAPAPASSIRKPPAPSQPSIQGQGDPNVRSPQQEEQEIGNFQRELLFVLQNQEAGNVDNNAMFDMIEKSIKPESRKSKEFIRALVSAVCFSCIKGESSRLDPELLKRRAVLLQKYIDSDQQRELQALYAVQALNVTLENPPFLLRLIFDVLYDEDVIPEETFYSWRDSQDPAEKTGKGIAMKSVTSFFTWLEESEG